MYFDRFNDVALAASQAALRINPAMNERWTPAVAKFPAVSGKLERWLQPIRYAALA